MYHSLCTTDVFVAGGGPAGLAAAIAARQAGFAVTLADAAHPPIDKTCGEGIMPDGLAALQKLGVSLPADQTYPFSGIQFSDNSKSVSAQFPHGRGLGIRRTRLHQVLVDRASELGVTLHWGARVTGIHDDGVAVNGRKICSRWVIGADGQNSRIRYWSGLEKSSSKKRRFGFRRHYRLAPWSEFVEVHWTDRGQVYVTPVAADEICVALITQEQGVRLNDALAVSPALASRLEGAETITREQGAITATYSLRAVSAGTRALLGEASGSVDAITGDGLSLAFQQAHALAQAMQAGDLRAYQRAHRRISRLPRMMAELMLFMDRSRWFRKRALCALAAEPSLFARMLAMHTGAMSPLDFGVQGTLELGWHLITA
jgi:flavin-dependent dehydrogenase